MQISEEQMEVFVDVLLPTPMLVIVGEAYLDRTGKTGQVLGYRTVIIDPRRPSAVQTLA
jgi:hypothetical protein